MGLEWMESMMMLLVIKWELGNNQTVSQAEIVF